MVGTSDVHDSFATNADRVYDVTDTECWTQSGNIDGRVQTSIFFFILTNGTRNFVKICSVY